MILDFPDNLNSSQSIMPEKQTKDWHSELKFLHYFPKNKCFGKEEQEITRNIKTIETHYKQKVQEMVSQLLTDEQGTLNIIPKKANIDLKRAIQPKLDKLKKKTERAIVDVLSIYLIQNKDERFLKKEVEKKEEIIEPQTTTIAQPIKEIINVYDKEIEFDDEDYDDDYETL
ncbi:unnamed protein product (macronuclear) [Paramecium tetraurelia]|uniref:Uncharacterized protein n=1 Tax=Paramecium tetraurelia TaxID=5888 RepID=A0DSD0_PARTE|nr:uncharacterized protein GSPATT00019651001 [Paramecium tetraurelia]CAK85947.1 unnamed protein product [Paramecium tetraurelia]|eukprot:XP_001453344.1 hypothetical protein (macronuclear) [Paramecium tetraurelia strain d4-2]